MNRFKIALTVGDPLSIGPEVSAKALHDFVKENKDVVVKVFSSPRVLKDHWTDRLKRAAMSGQIVYQFETSKTPSRQGKASAAIAIQNLRNAALACIENECDALVTGPVDKSLCALSEPNFDGQTGFIQKIAKSPRATMMLASDEMRVALVTQHLPLAQVARKLSVDKICGALTDLIFHLSPHSGLRIAVCGLNPHASDRGLLGTEEAKIIRPALKIMRKRFPQMKIEGPFSSDTLFIRASDYDAILAMYHDQGLIPLKMRGFDSAINVSMGLPFLRTSVDHGTAFDLVGTGKASYTSCLRALEYAVDWLRYKHSNPRRTRAQS